MSFATITAVSLPPQVYAHTASHDVALTADPTRFRAVTSKNYGWVKPTSCCGLWTSPVTARANDGLPSDSAWLEWCRCEMDSDTSDLLLTEILPVREARLLLIDCQEHLVAIIDAYPESGSQWPGRGRLYPNWSGLAADGWDGVYLTDRGQRATRLPRSGPDLYSWDLESMLWLRHAYTVGRTVRSAVRTEAGAT
jgi:hypothetical protein